MKIVHIQLSGFNEDMGYQENILPKYHKLLGHEVSIITSTIKIMPEGMYIDVEPGLSFAKDGIKVIRLSLLRVISSSFSEKLRIVRDLYNTLVSENPDILFIHGPQSISNLDVIKYLNNLKKKKSKMPVLLVDNHADEFNSAKSKLSKSIHKTLWRHVAKRLSKVTVKFYAVTDSAKEFLIKYYKLPPDKIELLVMGGDPSLINFNEVPQIRKEIRNKLNLSEDDFVLITGGKLDEKKGILDLMRLFLELENSNLKLIIFGTVHDAISKQFYTLLSSTDKIKYVGWLDLPEIYRHFVSADLGVFLGTQSVLWNHCIFCKLPAIFMYWPGMTDFTLGGRFQPCIIIQKATDFKVTLLKLVEDKELFQKLKTDAEKVSQLFSYEYIAKKSIEV